MNDLEFYRKKIDRLDDMIISALSERMNVVRNVGVYKAEHSLPVLDSGRENMILEKIAQYPYSESIAAVYETILKQSREIQNKI